MMAAFALLTLQAMATAPVISDIPSPVVGNEGVTGSTSYIYPNAFDLNTKYSDDNTTAGQGQWSYTIAGTPNYRINNVDPIVVGTDSIITPGAKRINGATNDPADTDAKTNTVTVRDIRFTPITGTAPETPGASGIVHAQVVTFFASDGTTVTPAGKSNIFYTELGGSDHLSVKPSGGVDVIPTTAPYGVGGTWTFSTLAGTVTSATTNNGVCMSVPANGDNYGGWASPWNLWEVKQGKVYKVRARIQGSQTASGTVPLCDLVIDNYDGTHGLNLFGGDFIIFDNEGDANAAFQVAGTGTDYFFWWAPNAIGTASWVASTGLYGTSYTANDRMARLQFRVLDVTSNAGLQSQNKLGQLCLNEIQVTAFDLTAMKTLTANVYTNTALDATNFQAAPLVGSTVAYAGGAVTITNTTGSASIEYIQCYPGDATINFATPSSIPDNYPVIWDSNTLYQVTVDMIAPTAGDETNPYDVYWVGMDTPTNEFIVDNFITGNANRCATPKLTSQTWMAFFWSANETHSVTSQLHRLRPRLNIANAGGLAFYTNTGATKVTAMKVNKVSF